MPKTNITDYLTNYIFLFLSISFYAIGGKQANELPDDKRSPMPPTLEAMDTLLTS